MNSADTRSIVEHLWGIPARLWLVVECQGHTLDSVHVRLADEVIIQDLESLFCLESKDQEDMETFPTEAEHPSLVVTAESEWQNWIEY